jgi:hypothetical protein
MKIGKGAAFAACVFGVVVAMNVEIAHGQYYTPYIGLSCDSYQVLNREEGAVVCMSGGLTQSNCEMFTDEVSASFGWVFSCDGTWLPAGNDPLQGQSGYSRGACRIEAAFENQSNSPFAPSYPGTPSAVGSGISACKNAFQNFIQNH